MRNRSQLPQQRLIALLIDVVDRVADRTPRIQHLPFNIDSAIRQNVVNRAQNSRHIMVDVHQPVRSGTPSLAYFAKGGIPRTTPSGDLIFPRTRTRSPKLVLPLGDSLPRSSVASQFSQRSSWISVLPKTPIILATLPAPSAPNLPNSPKRASSSLLLSVKTFLRYRAFRSEKFKKRMYV